MLRLIAAGFLAGCISLSWAQDETVVITATRFADARRDLPIGVTVITADDIRKSASSNLPDILAQFGLLQIRNLAGTQNQQIDLRGFGITGDQNTLILIDGLRITENELESAQLSAIPLESIERIEIVRGGGAVLYGGGATGGTINIITRRGVPGETRAHALARAGARTKRSRFSLGSAFGDFAGSGDVEQWTFSPRAKLVFGRAHELVLGVDLEHWDLTSGATFAGFPSFQRTSEQSNAAVYAQANLWLGTATRLVLGAREQRMAQRLNLEFPTPTTERTSSHRLEAYEAALRHAWGPGWSSYARLGKSFRVANFDENACFSPFSCPTELLKPQTALGAELGMEYETSRVRARASVYQIDLENEIYFSPLVPPFGANINLSPTRRRGFELETLWRAVPSVDLRAALALMQAEFRSGTFGGVDVSGKTVPLVPQVLATVGASWTFAPRSRANLNARYVGRQRFDNDQANLFRQQPEYALVDAKVEYRLRPRWDVAFEVRNLFDKRYFSYGRVDDPFAPTTFSALPEPGRAAYASLAWRLD